ncbi:MAG: hypothetical protein LBS24_03840 [Clostridiales Family XIII bacterium]|jgi:hypothetical protein|nr:hypothetical protein [Clostridiales Family XIII bacterium]
MLHFFVSNAATIIISALLASAILAIVVGGIRKLLRGQGSGCACGCGACDRACLRGDARSRHAYAPKVGISSDLRISKIN